MKVHIRDVENELNWGVDMETVPGKGDIVHVDDRDLEVLQVRHVSGESDDDRPALTLRCRPPVLTEEEALIDELDASE